MAKRVKTKIVNIEKSPFQNLYFIDLACGHQVIRQSFIEGMIELECFECKQLRKKKKQGK